ncbi:polyprenyl synthetase family protein [Sulfuriroseicoccus oceanibius]|uniref:Polyprenyl synthetase family protein n=1 Tax=Sulfuriroseicoccus oceanibius TaxID=2707525 RepID=A0A6B3LA01_9BACT|nr:farnesyl diphosphate synthase [Sulfuriroseicoccus oceanibius]QQL44726.1 polyprenyl synthetase family protein [Sulfuriroseicoccus oceanibius]
MSASAFNLKDYLASHTRKVEQALNKNLPTKRTSPAVLHEAMRHSMFAGGKRLRPILALAAAEACGGKIEDALLPACAVECIHTYSLIHDDLPCMDDDDMRRGVPTCHVVYGEANALLAGDALAALAFELIAQHPGTENYSTAAMVSELAHTSGSRWLIGGQVLDLECEGDPSKVNAARLKQIHLAKTSALLTTSLRLGAMAANASTRELEALTEFGQATGLAFQIIDDILDATQSSEKLGKTAGKDAATGKATYPAIHGMEKSKKEAARLTRKALDALIVFKEKGTALDHIGRYLLDRDY